MSQKQISEVTTVQQEVGQEGRIFSFKATQWLWLGLTVIQTLITIRIILKLIGANSENPFALFIYNLSSVILFPFAGLVGNPMIGGMVLELSSIIAMVIYALLAWGIERTIWVIFYRPRGSEASITQTTTREATSQPTSESNDYIQMTTRK